jgi:hypothetical protein
MQTIGRVKVEYGEISLVDHQGETKAWVDDFLRNLGGCVVTVREVYDEAGELDAVLFLREHNPC